MKKYENAVGELKSQLKKSEVKICNLQEEIANQNNKIQGEKSVNLKSSEDINFYQKQVREKELKIKELNEELE